MGQLNFPTNPVVGQQHTIGNNTWEWSGSAWIKYVPPKNVVGVFTVTDALYVTSTTNSIDTLTGALVVTGGVGIGRNVNVGGTLNVAGDVQFTSLTGADVAGGGAGALKVSGGVYVGDDVIINSTAWNTGTNSSNALYIKGGAWIDRSLVVEGAVLFKNGVTFSGTATYVYSTNTVYTDNLIDLHVPPGGLETPWTYDDGKDIGLTFHYYKGADKTGFLGFANDTGYLEWYNDGLESGGVFTGTSYGTFKTSDIQLTGLTNSSNTTSGALQVAGGVGVGLNVYAGGNISGGTVNARNLTQTRLVIAGASGQLTDDIDLTWNSSLNQIEGRAAYANTATLSEKSNNLVGGSAGAIPYQTALDTTTFLNIGTNGYVLLSNGSAPYWAAATGLAAGTATTATNISGGAKDRVPYQTDAGATTFSNDLRFNGTVFTTTNVVVTGITDTSGNANSGALQVAGGVGIDKNLWVGDTVTVGSTVTNTVVPVVSSNNLLLSSFTSNTISSTSTQNLDVFNADTYRTARYTIQIVDGSSIHVTEMTIFHDGTNVYMNEYGISTNNGQLGSFGAQLSGGNVTLMFTPTAASSMVIKLVRIGITS
jgi:hypothetical protein